MPLAVELQYQDLPIAIKRLAGPRSGIDEPQRPQSTDLVHLGMIQDLSG